MKVRYYILMTAVAAGTAVASAAEVNVRWTRRVVDNASSTQKPQPRRLAALLGRIQVHLNTNDLPLQSQANVVGRHSSHKRQVSASRGDTCVRVFVNSRRQASCERNALVSVVVEDQPSSKQKPIESAVQKQGSAVQKARPVQKPNYVGGQLRPFQH